jgi:hypothetical protein
MAERDEPTFTAPIDPDLLEGDVEEPSGGRGFLPDGVRKAILAGVGALFMTEEGARRLARDWKLPKEVIGFIGQQASSAKDEVMRVFAEEVRRFLQSDAVRRELGKVLESMAVEIHAEIRLKPADAEGPARPEVKARVSPAAKRKKGKR